MIVWINGTFGVGKTTTANALASREGWRSFDPEHVGYLLANNMSDLDFEDFQELPPWRSLVPAVAEAIYLHTKPQVMVAVQTVLAASIWEELLSGFRERQLAVFHVVLDCSEPVLRSRIEADTAEPGARQWRLDHIAEFEAARSWLADAADLVVDTTNLSADAVVEQITEALVLRAS